MEDVERLARGRLDLALEEPGEEGRDRQRQRGAEPVARDAVAARPVESHGLSASDPDLAEGDHRDRRAHHDPPVRNEAEVAFVGRQDEDEGRHEKGGPERPPRDRRRG